ADFLYFRRNMTSFSVNLISVLFIALAFFYNYTKTIAMLQNYIVSTLDIQELVPLSEKRGEKLG
ncbi:MAG: hypothetical protein K9J16_00735, partial [Melioribacteraceae bacterium]|nr:hypothetical protein [Melioribacteraceae bacterium]MCF8356390.1 hypothetical protein [Melioribacteraceae bacterium]MCF8392251.1 hypothetical protein [Melioribacteraceae bacterium]MCF8417582.1 hypothetical protein [Melioribacteraceae bacterium]